MIRFLLWVGLVARKHNGKIAYPFHVPPRWCWRSWRDFKAYARFCGGFYVFRNKGARKWVPGRLLPRRWGFGIYGFEFGDRGH
jgi:hypothetical protein